MFNIIGTASLLLLIGLSANAQSAPQQSPADQTAENRAAADRHRFASGMLLAHFSDVPFDGRDEWEHRLYDSRTKVMEFQLEHPGVVRADAVTPATEDEKKQFAALNKEFLDLVNKGVRRAVEERRSKLPSLSTPELVAYRHALMSMGHPPPELWVREADQQLARAGLRFDEKTGSVQPMQKEDKQQ